MSRIATPTTIAAPSATQRRPRDRHRQGPQGVGEVRGQAGYVEAGSDNLRGKPLQTWPLES